MKNIVISFLNKPIWVAVVSIAIALGIGFGWFYLTMPGDLTFNVKSDNVLQKADGTGHLALGFLSSGRIKNVSVKPGDNVKKGDVLAELDSASAAASLLTAKGSLAQAQANYEKLIDGSTRQLTLDQAYQSALNNLADAKLKSYNALDVVTKLQNAYFTGFDGDARDGKAQIQNAFALIDSSLDKAKNGGSQAEIDQAVSTALDSLSIISNALGIIRQTCDEPYYYGKIPEAQKGTIDAQRGYINAALISVTGSQQAIASAKISLSQKQPEIDAAKAQILSAKGQVDMAQAVYDNTVIKAPNDGIVTAVKISAGQIASQNSPAIEITINSK